MAKLSDYNFIINIPTTLPFWALNDQNIMGIKQQNLKKHSRPNTFNEPFSA